jgi:RNA polymerase sigma-70 factor (ECF subfamily)
MFPYSPKQVVGGFNRRDRKVNQDIYAFYYPIVLQEIRKQTGNCPDLRDLVSIVFTKLWEKERFKTMKGMRDHINRTTFHTWTNYLKKQEMIKSNSVNISQHLFSLATDAQKRRESEAYLLDLIYKEVEKLPDRTREVFLLHHKHRMPNDEIAQKLGIAEQTVKNLVSSAKTTLKMKFKRKDGVEKAAIIFLLVNFIYDKF